jgi:peptidoglycan/LPS O-acetylase OafA/YrhL
MAKGNRITGIDVLRGLAAFAVVCAHYFNWWNQNVAGIIIPEGHYGYHAVQLFFAISGLVIFNTLQRCHSVLHFGYLRFSRLYPTYWASLLLFAALSWLIFDNAPWWGGLVVNATMIQEFLGYPHYDNVYWSLSAELVFYAHAAWLFALGWHRRVFAVCTVWLLLSCAWALTVGKGDSRDVWALYLVVDQAAFFVLGIMVSDILRRGFDRLHVFVLGLAAATAFFVEGTTGLTVWATVAALVFLATYGKLGLVTNRATLWLGAISYSLYLIHRNLGFACLERLADAGYSAWAAILPTMAVALLLAWLLNVLVERPSLTVLRQYRVGRPRSPATASRSA